MLYDQVLQAVWYVTLLSAVPLGLGMLVGFVCGVLQAATQIQEQTLTFVPKLVVIGAALYFGGPPLAGSFVEFCSSIFRDLPHAGLG